MAKVIDAASRPTVTRQTYLDAEHPRVLPEPTVTLYANRTAESRRAFDLLDQADILVEVIPAPRKRQPEAHWGPLRFRGVEQIADLAALRIETREIITTLAPVLLPELFVNGPHPDDGPHWEKWRALARYVIDELIPQGQESRPLDEPQAVDEIGVAYRDLDVSSIE